MLLQLINLLAEVHGSTWALWDLPWPCAQIDLWTRVTPFVVVP